MFGSLKKIWQFSEKRHDAIGKGLLLSFLRSLFGICQLFSIIITAKVLLGTILAKTGIYEILGLTVLCILGNFLTSYFEQTATMEAGFFMTADKRVSLADHLRKLPLGYFTEASAGRIPATLTTTLFAVESAAPMVMVNVISGLFNSLTLFLFMMFYDWRIGLLSGLGMIAYLLVVSWQMGISRKNAPALESAQAELSEAVVTFLRGIKVTKAFRFQKGDKRLKKAIEGSCEGNISLTSTSMPSQFAANLTIAVFESAILLLSLWFCFGTGSNDLVKTIVLMIFSFMVYASLNQAGSILSMIGLMDTSLDEAKKIQEAQPLPEKAAPEKAASNAVEFQNVSFSYGNREVLHGVSTSIAPNTLTAVIGPSGSGKTTLCQLIPRFRDVTAGAITLGGVDLRDLAYEDVMARVSMVFQNVYLFEDSILNNIRFGKPEATLEQVQEAAKKARCHDFIMQLPQGYDTMIEEGGASLSGGEKQRISIARALLKDAPIVILDEATSALDAENEQEILSAIDELTRNKTVIMIAHRIKSVEKADHIIALEDGRIVQEGSHESLKDKEGLYRSFLETRAAAAHWQL